MITGLHHLTAITGNAKQNVHFYTNVLGLRLVKQTVNFDDPGAWHLYYGNAKGEPGTILTFFEWSHLSKGATGIGATHHVAMRVGDRDALLKWKRRLTDLGHHVNGPYNRTYFESIYTTDPDGLILEIATDGPGFGVDESNLGASDIDPQSDRTLQGRNQDDIKAETWSEPVNEITDDMTLFLGMHHVSAISGDIVRTDEFMQKHLGLNLVKKTKNFDDTNAQHWYWGNEKGSPGTLMTYFGYTPETYRYARMGTGMTHHVAFSIKDEEEQLKMRESLLKEGVKVSPVMDRTYFRSIYFNDPDGHILEIATENPGFNVDEDWDSLGTTIQLPKQFEPLRSQIETQLSPLY